MSHPSDDLLVERLKRGDAAAVIDLERAYGARILTLARRYLKNYEDAQEVAQDVLLKVTSKIGRFRGDSALGSWIFRITFNAAMSRLRSERADPTQRAPAAPTDADAERRSPREPADWSVLGDEHVMRAQLRDELALAVRELPPIYRAPVILRDLRGLSTEEASVLLKVKVQTVKSRLHRGRLILRERLRDFADGLTLHRPLPA